MTTKTPGRKPKEVAIPAAIDPALDQDKLSGAMEAMREHGMADREAEDTQLAQAAQAVGGALMARLHKNFSHAAEVSMFMQVRELPLAVLRRVPLPKLPDASGSFAAVPQGGAEKLPDTSGNLDDFCRRVFARSYNTMQEEAQSFSALGEQAYETAARLGLSKNALRVTRALPPEKLEVVRTAISAGSTKAEVLSVIEDLAEKVQQTEAALTEAHAELEATTQLLADKNKALDKAKAAQKRINAEPPDERMAAIQSEAAGIAADVQARILGTLRQAILAVVNSGDDRTQHDAFLAGLVGQVQACLTGVRDEFNLPQLSDKPEWMQYAEAQEKAAANA